MTTPGAAWTLALISLAGLGLVVVLGGDARAPEPRWRAPLSELEGGPAVAWATCQPDMHDERRIVPEHITLTLTGAGEARADDPAVREWLREKAAVLQLVCMTGELEGRLQWDVPSGEAAGIKGAG